MNEKLNIGFVVKIVGVDCSVADRVCGACYIATLGRGGIGGRIEGVTGWCYACEVFKKAKVIGFGAVGESTACIECD